MKVIKKNGIEQDFDIQKVINAVSKSADRCMYKFSDDEVNEIKNVVTAMAVKYTTENNTDKIPINIMHNIAEKVLYQINPEISESYKSYRNYKIEFANILDNVYRKSQSIKYIGDVSNANTDATMISTQRSLVYGQLNKNLYQKFFLNKKELKATEEGYIYIHDMKDRLDGFNCQLFDMANVLNGGFEMGNQWYTEPKTLDVAFDVISDITISAASQQYGK